jgi:hypothetical protein
MGFTPLWLFATSPDGSTTTATTGTTAWAPQTSYLVSQYVSKAGSWYRATTGGQSGSTGPSGTGASIVDGSVVWSFVTSGGVLTLLSEPPVVDFERMGAFFSSISWFDLVPSGLGGAPTLIASGGGTYAGWSDTNAESGGMDWVASAVTQDRKLLVAYVPDAHSGSVTVAMTALSGDARARWFDPTSGSYVADASGAGYGLPNTGTHAFTTPGANASGANDWALVIDVGP